MVNAKLVAAWKVEKHEHNELKHAETLYKHTQIRQDDQGMKMCLSYDL